MRLGTIAQAELLDRLGVKGADLYRFTVLESAIPVVVVADASSLGGEPKRRQSAMLNTIGAVAGQLGWLEIATLTAPLTVRIKNTGAAQSLNIFHQASAALTAGLFLPALPAQTYQTADFDLQAPFGFQLAFGTLAPAGAGTLIDAIGTGQTSQEYRLSPNGRLAITGSVVNTVAAIQFVVEEFAAYERSR